MCYVSKAEPRLRVIGFRGEKPFLVISSVSGGKGLLTLIALEQDTMPGT